jgi:hypothetical protein
MKSLVFLIVSYINLFLLFDSIVPFSHLREQLLTVLLLLYLFFSPDEGDLVRMVGEERRLIIGEVSFSVQ